MTIILIVYAAMSVVTRSATPEVVNANTRPACVMAFSTACQPLLQCGQNVRQRDLCLVTRAAVPVFNDAVAQAALADDEAVGNADQVGICKFDAGACIPIIQQHFDACFLNIRI